MNADPDCQVEAGTERKRCNDPAVDIPIEKKIPHEDYDVLSLDQHNDIALLLLARDVPFAEFSQPICLPSPTATSIDEENGRFVVAGWGELNIHQM